MGLFFKNKELIDLPNEIWVDCFGYDGIYSVSNLGRVKSEGRWVSNGKSERFVKERILSQAELSDGRLTVNLSINNIAESKQVHQLVFYSFHPEKINDKLRDEVYHINKILNDNRLENLGYNEIQGKSYKISIELGNVKHLETARKAVHKYTKDTAQIINGEVAKRKCKSCGELKDVSFFEYKRNTCIECRKIEKRNRYKSQKALKKT